MKIVQCEGYPETTCPFDAEAVYDMLGYQLCEACADNWRKQPTREDQHTGATIASLRAELEAAHKGIFNAARDFEALRAELAALTKAANLAYDALDWQLECWNADDDGVPPSDLLNAHAALFGLLRYVPEGETHDEVSF